MDNITSYKYNSVESSITSGTTNSSVAFGDVTVGYAGEIINDNATAGENLIVRFNTTTSPETTIQAGESKSFSEFEYTKIYLSNSSGSTINYRITIMGV